MRPLRSVFALVVCAAVCSSGCAFVQLRTTGVVVVPEGGGVAFHDYEAVDTVPMTETAIFCILTALFYGGGCWTYLAVPFDGQIVDQRNMARGDIKQALPCGRVLDLQVEAVGWNVQRRWFAIRDDRNHTFTTEELVDLCRRAPAKKEKPPWKPPAADALPPLTQPQTNPQANPLPPSTLDPAG